MATYNFTTSGSNWSLIVDGSTKGPWPRHSSGISSPLYKVDTTGTAIVLSVNAEPYYSTKIRSTDTVQINGVEKTGTLTEKEMAIESEAIAAESTGAGASEVTVYQLKKVLTHSQILSMVSSPVEIVPAPGAGKMLSFMKGWMMGDCMAGAYTNVMGFSQCALVINNGTGMEFLVTDYGGGRSSLFTTTTAKPVENLTPELFSAYSFEIDNRPITLSVQNGAGDLTGGNPANTLTVTVFYSIVDLE